MFLRLLFNWMHESALSGCDRFGRWIATYAEDLPPAYFAKSLLEVDYANDDLFWKGHFYQELEEIKERPYFGSRERAQLKELQDIVWNRLLSPYAYAKGLQALEKQSLFSGVRNIRAVFHLDLKENPDVVLHHLRKDLVNSIEEMENNGEGTHKTFLTDFKEMLTYYRNAMNTFDYAETLASIINRDGER